MFFGGYLKLALASLRNAKWRSLLTMLGIVIGVVSVVTTVSLGEGVKQQVIQQINHRGADLITIVPGRRTPDSGGGSRSILGSFSAPATLFSDGDYRVITRNNTLSLVVPFGEVIGVAKTRERELPDARIVATTQGLPAMLNQKVQFGTFFNDTDTQGNGVIIGKRVAERLFQENVPIGKSLTIRGQNFIVRGIFEEFNGGLSLLPGSDYNNTIFLPYNTGLQLMGGTIQIYHILAKPAKQASIDQAITSVTAGLKKARADQHDFTVLKQSESLALASDVLNLLTGLIAGIAAISLLVGGIGIMNIMLVAVTERTREIGVRKAIGATNRQILYQFLIEATVLGVVGGILGVIMSVVANIVLRITTDLQPVISLPIILVATGVSLVVGLIFGVMPALKAARKDPIDALRYE